MVEIAISMLRTRKFLCCVDLRAATLTLVWMTVLFYALIMCHLVSNFMTNWPKSSPEAAARFLETGCIFMGAIPSILCLIHFPAPDETYLPNSKSAKCVKFFAFYYGLVSVTFLACYFTRVVAVGRENYPRRLEILLLEGLIHFAFTGLFIHLTAVIYSFYLSVLTSGSIGFNNDEDVGSRDKNRIVVGV